LLVDTLRDIHGDPLKPQSTDEFLHLLNHKILPQEKTQMARVVADRVRTFGFVTPVAAGSLIGTCMILALSCCLPGNPGLVIIAMIAAVLLVSPVTITALLLAARIKRDYLQTPAASE
jgi:hypothetical protein